MEITKLDERLQMFQTLDMVAAECFNKSQEELSKAIVALNAIRENALYLDGGFETWNDYLSNFLGTNGISRSLVYENLAVARLASGAGFNENEIVEYGLYTLKPWFSRDGPILEYDRKTGEITKVVAAVEEKLPDGDNYSSRYGEFVRQRVGEGEPPSLVWKAVREEMCGTEISFGCYVSDGKVTGLSWNMERDGQYSEGDIRFTCKPGVPEEVEDRLLKMLDVPTGWR